VSTLRTPLRRRPRTIERRRAATAEGRYGSFPWVALSCAAGVAVTWVADALSRTGHHGGSELFWVAICLITVPATLRMSGQRASSGERAAIVVVFGLSLYAIKVLRDPFSLTYADELVHFHNLQSILATGQLFGTNTILPITPRYPGLESVAAAMVRIGGISPFAAALLLIACGRVVIMLALYAFFERVSGSRQVAGLGTLVYAATPTFLFFSSQFSYESLALPLASVALYSLVRWLQAPSDEARQRWIWIILLIAATVVVTHHITAYALVALLVTACVLHWRLRGWSGAPWLVTLCVALLAAGWLVFAAGGTIGYLAPVLNDAINKLVQTLHGEAATRVLFANQGGVETTPFLERAVAILGIAVLGLYVLAGTRLIWRRRWRRNPLLVVLALAAIAYLATLPLRFVPAAWETASRASEFLFVGVGMIVALGMVWIMERPGADIRRTRQLIAWSLALVLASGIIAGWPASLRLALPLEVKAVGHTIEPPGYVAAKWSGQKLGPTQVVAAEDSDARLFLDYANQAAYTGVFPDVDDMLASKTLQGWHGLLKRYRITLVETDLREISTDVIAGYFFNVGSTPLMAPGTANKFDLPDVDRIFDGGNFTIYAVRRLW
jgi:hypothetical protein